MVAGIDISLKHTFMIAFTIVTFAVMTLIYINIIAAASSTYTGLVGENLAHAINMVYAAPSDRDSIMLLTQTKGRFIVNFPVSKEGVFVIEPLDDSVSTNKATHTSYIFNDIDIVIDDFLIYNNNDISVCPAGTREYQTPLINKKGKCATDPTAPCYYVDFSGYKCRAQEKISAKAFIFSGPVCINKTRAEPNKITLYPLNSEGKC